MVLSLSSASVDNFLVDLSCLVVGLLSTCWVTNHCTIPSNTLINPTEYPRYTVEPRPVDTPSLWTPHPCGHFLPGSFVFLVHCDPCTEGKKWSQHGSNPGTVSPFLKTAPGWSHFGSTNFLSVATPTFTRGDISLLLTIFVRPSGIYITEVLQYVSARCCTMPI